MVHLQAAGVAFGLAILAAVPVAVAARVSKKRGPVAPVVAYAVGVFARFAIGMGGAVVVLATTGAFDGRTETFWIWQAVGYLIGLGVETAWLARYWAADAPGGG